MGLTGFDMMTFFENVFLEAYGIERDLEHATKIPEIIKSIAKGEITLQPSPTEQLTIRQAFEEACPEKSFEAACQKSRRTEREIACMLLGVNE